MRCACGNPAIYDTHPLTGKKTPGLCRECSEQIVRRIARDVLDKPYVSQSTIRMVMEPGREKPVAGRRGRPPRMH